MCRGRSLTRLETLPLQSPTSSIPPRVSSPRSLSVPHAVQPQVVIPYTLIHHPCALFPAVRCHPLPSFTPVYTRTLIFPCLPLPPPHYSSPPTHTLYHVLTHVLTLSPIHSLIQSFARSLSLSVSQLITQSLLLSASFTLFWRE